MSVGASIFWICVVFTLINIAGLVGIIALRFIDDWLDGLLKARVKKWLQ